MLGRDAGSYLARWEITWCASQDGTLTWLRKQYASHRFLDQLVVSEIMGKLVPVVSSFFAPAARLCVDVIH